jgi:AcrR family transcriptional regulator
VAQGTFYLYFPDKKSVFVELVRELGAQLRQALRAATADCTTRLDVEREGLRAFLHFSRDHRDLYRIVRQCEFVDAKAYRAYYQTLADVYARGLEKAMTAKELRAGHPERIAYFLMGIADFSGMRWILWDEGADLDALVDEAIAFIRRGLEPQPTPKERRR